MGNVEAEYCKTGLNKDEFIFEEICPCIFMSYFTSEQSFSIEFG